MSALSVFSGLGLLVDDDVLYMRTLQRSLQKRGFATVLANNAADAVTAAQVYQPAFALIELRLGHDSGFALIETLRAVREDMQILLVTGYASAAIAVEAIKRGADNHLTKPLTAEAIVRALNDEPEAKRRLRFAPMLDRSK